MNKSLKQRSFLMLNESFSLLDYINIMQLKHQLLFLSSDDLMERYQEQDKYGLFLDTVNIMNFVDRGFLLFDPNVVERIENVIYQNRFLYQDEDFLRVTNDIICHLNSLGTYSQMKKNMIKEHYLDFHEQVRKLEFASEEDFLLAIGYDAVSYHMLVNNSFESMNECCFLSSINYFVGVFPEMFLEGELGVRAEYGIDAISKKRGFRRKPIRDFASVTRENFQKVIK